MCTWYVMVLHTYLYLLLRPEHNRRLLWACCLGFRVTSGNAWSGLIYYKSPLGGPKNIISPARSRLFISEVSREGTLCGCPSVRPSVCLSVCLQIQLRSSINTTIEARLHETWLRVETERPVFDAITICRLSQVNRFPVCEDVVCFGGRFVLVRVTLL